MKHSTHLSQKCNTYLKLYTICKSDILYELTNTHLIYENNNHNTYCLMFPVIIDKMTMAIGNVIIA